MTAQSAKHAGTGSRGVDVGNALQRRSLRRRVWAAAWLLPMLMLCAPALGADRMVLAEEITNDG